MIVSSLVVISLLKFLALATLKEKSVALGKTSFAPLIWQHWCNQVGVPTQLGWPNDPRITRKTTIDNTIVDQRTYLHNLVMWKVGSTSNSDHAQIWMKLDHFVNNDQRSSDSLTQYKSTKNNWSDDDAINFANKTTAIICKNNNKLNDIDETCAIGKTLIQAALECKLIKQVKTTNKKRFQQTHGWDDDCEKIKQNKRKIEKTIKQLKILMNPTQQQKQQLVTLCRQRNIIARKLRDTIKQKKIKSWESYLQRLDERNCNGTKVMTSRQAWDRIRKINGSTKRKKYGPRSNRIRLQSQNGDPILNTQSKTNVLAKYYCNVSKKVPPASTASARRITKQVQNFVNNKLTLPSTSSPKWCPNGTWKTSQTRMGQTHFSRCMNLSLLWIAVVTTQPLALMESLTNWFVMLLKKQKKSLSIRQGYFSKKKKSTMNRNIIF